jgi:hypothetical protein
MDIFNFSKIVEQGIYDVMMWILFYPLTLVRVLFAPRSTLAYVRSQQSLDIKDAFATAMRPALFLFITICITSFISPIDNTQIGQYERSEIGKLLLESFAPYLVFNTVIYSLLPLTGAVLVDLLTPGTVTRSSLRLPFEQQCYIASPFALLLVGLLFLLKGQNPIVEGLLVLALLVWFLLAQYFFFRDNSKLSALVCALLSIATVAIGISLISVAVFITIG